MKKAIKMRYGNIVAKYMTFPEDLMPFIMPKNTKTHAPNRQSTIFQFNIPAKRVYAIQNYTSIGNNTHLFLVL